MLTVIGCIGELDESLTDLKVKDCIEDPGEDEEIASVHEVDCQRAEAAFRVTRVLVASGDSDYPGESALSDEAARRCPGDTAFTLYPTSRSWESADDRTIVCFSEND
jgi:hypothetical protein